MTKTQGKVDPLLYEYVPAFGVAGGPDVLRLTDAGELRAYNVANNLSLSERELTVLLEIVALGPYGRTIDGAPVISLAAKGLIGFLNGKYFATKTGVASVEKAEEEAGILRARIRAENRTENLRIVDPKEKMK